MKKNKVVIVGTGMVGMSYAYSMVNQGTCEELVLIDLDKIPVKEETKAICQAGNISPYALISSGSMIITAFEGEKLVDALKEKGIESAIIGTITQKEKQIIKQEYEEKREALLEKLNQKTMIQGFQVKSTENGVYMMDTIMSQYQQDFYIKTI